MKIAIDIDDTLTNTRNIQKKLWKDYYKKNPNKNYSKKLPNNINEFGIEYIQNFWDIYRDELSFSCTFKKDASKVLNKLLKDGHKLCIVTSRPEEKYSNLILQLDKWFKKNNIPIKDIYPSIINKGKFCLENKIDLLIDDNIKQCQDALDNNIKAILFNKDNKYKGPQAKKWSKIYEIIKNKTNF